jgi:hypothetical protein
MKIPLLSGSAPSTREGGLSIFDRRTLHRPTPEVGGDFIDDLGFRRRVTGQSHDTSMPLKLLNYLLQLATKFSLTLIMTGKRPIQSYTGFPTPII